MSLAERIKELLEYTGKNPSQFSKEVGFKTPQTIREILKGNTKNLSEIVRYKIERVYPEINMHWLIAGVGSMLDPRDDGRLFAVEYNEQGRTFHLNAGNSPENIGGNRTVCKTTEKQWYKFRLYLNNFLHENISYNDRLSIQDELSFEDVVTYWNKFKASNGNSSAVPTSNNSVLATAPQLPKTSDDPTISELLSIIRSQQETIKTLSETISAQSETVRDLTKNK